MAPPVLLPPLFPPPVSPGWHGAVTPIGTTRFNAARRRLAQLAGREVEQVGDPDVVVFLALGETEALRLLHPDG